jgi:glucosyl-dolichyl phosphate glucuronosyltransferase
LTVPIPILLYHSVREGADGDRFTVKPSVFREHLAAIRAAGRTPMTISELAAAVRGEQPLPDAPMAITFDDGFADTADAVAALAADGISSTVFITTGAVGARLMLSEAGVRDLAATPGVEVGAHTVHHPRLDELRPTEAAAEIVGSRTALEEMLGAPVQSFAYPHGAYSRDVRQAVQTAGFTAAAAVRNALSSDTDDPLALARWTVTRGVSADRVAAVLEGRGVGVAPPRERLRTRAWRAGRRTRRRLAPNASHRVRTRASGGIRRIDATAGTVAVVVCTASPTRSAQLLSCVDSIRDGVRRPDELVVVVDRDVELHRSLRAALPADVKVLRSARAGLSEARNTGIGATTSDVVAFIDDDARPEPEWLDRLVAPLDADPELLGAGGDVVPDWEDGPRWLPEELLWMVGCRYRGHPVEPGPIRNPIGCNMAFRRRALAQLGGFAAEFGKRGRAPVVCEETELCLRLERDYGEGRIYYVPGARVQHRVPAERVSWRLLVVRSFSEGLSKARLRRLYPGSAVRNERRYLTVVLGRALPALLGRAVVRRDLDALAGGVAIVASLACSAVGFAIGLAAPGPRPRAAT